MAMPWLANASFSLAAMPLALGEVVVFVLVVVVVQPAIDSKAIAISATITAAFRVIAWPPLIWFVFLA